MEKPTADLEAMPPPPTHHIQHPSHPAAARPRRRRTIISNGFIVVCLVLIFVVVVTRPGCLSGPYPSYLKPWNSASEPSDRQHDHQQPLETDESYGISGDADITSTKVPFEAHIMSKCPDAQACMLELVVPAMEQIHDKVDFRLSFIGNASESSDRVSCMHGPGECVGDMLILCAANLPFPPSSASAGSDYSTLSSSLSSLSTGKTPAIRSLGFANCLLSQYENIPDRTLVHNCAAEYGIDFGALNRCVSRGLEMGSVELWNADDGQDDDNVSLKGKKYKAASGDDEKQPSGLDLLRKSFARSKQVGASKSCTVRVDEKVWCIHDGGEWTECGDGEYRSEVWALVDEIERLWQDRN